MKRLYKKAILSVAGTIACSGGFAQMNYTNLEWVDRSPIVSDSIFHSSTIVVSGKTFVTTNKVNGSGNTDIYTLKIDSNGDTLWSTVKNGTATGSMDYGVELVSDASGNIYVAGAIQNTSTGYDYSVIKYNGSTGAIVWDYAWNGAGNGEDIPSKIIIDGVGGALYVSGGSEASNGFSNFGIIRVSASGTLVWSQYYDYNGLHDASTTLSFSGTSYVIASGGSAAAVGDWDLATVRLSKTTGAVISSTRSDIAGATMVEANAMTTDALNNIYITGYAVVSAEKNIQSVKLDSNLALIWIKEYTAGTYSDEGNDIGVDNSGNVYVCGYNEISAGGASNFFTIKYNSGGTQQWVHQIGNAGDTEFAKAERMAVTSDGDVYLTGTSEINSQSKMMFVKYNTSGDLELAREYESDTVNYEAYDINVSGNDVYITGLEKTVAMTRLTILKYGIAERVIEPVLEGGVESYVDGELIIEFRPQDVIEATINDKGKTFGDLSDFVDSGVIDDLQINYPGLDWERATTYKIFQGLTTNDTLSITPDGYATEMYPFYAYLLVEVGSENVEHAIDSLREYMFPAIQSVNVNSLFSLLSNDPEYIEQNSLYPNDFPNGDINIEPAWLLETGKSTIKVGVYDSGIMYSHTDLGGGIGTNKKIKGGKDYFTGGGLNTIANNGDEHGHGTKVAGVIGAYTNNNEGIAGIGGGNWPYDNTVTTPTNPTTENQGLSLYGFKLTNHVPLMSLDLTAQALLEGSSNTSGGYGYGLHILNCSFQKTVDASLPQADFNDTLDLMYNVQRQIFKNGTVLVAGQGNDNVYNYKTPAYSVMEFWVIGVGGSDTAGVRHGESNYGIATDVIAPYSMELTYTTSNTGNNDYTSFSQTSCATPHVSGVAGLMLSHINDLPETPSNLVADDVEFLIQRYAHDVSGLPGTEIGWDANTGSGLLDAGNVMTNINREQYVIRHYYVDTTFVLANATLTTGTFNIKFEDGTHEYDTYSGDLYYYEVSHMPDALNMGDVILNYWPLNSYTNMMMAPLYLPGLSQKENEMDINIIDQTAFLSGYTMLIKNGPDGDIPDFWYPVAPDAQVRFGYTLHIQTDYTATEEITTEFQFSCYPNPASTDYTISFNLSETAIVSAEIVDVQGRIVNSFEQKSFASGQQFVNFTVNNLSKGMYVVKLKVNDEIYYEKFIKQ